MSRRGKQRKWPKNESLRGTNLYRDQKTGLLYWRRTDPLTGKRCSPKATGESRRKLAIRKCQGWEDEFDRRAAGVKTYDCWRLPLLPLVAEWIADRRGSGDLWLRQERSAVERALETLQLETAADLTHVSEVEARLRSLPITDSTMRRRYQQPLQRFSKWLAGNRRYLEQNPLECWEPITYDAASPHRCYDPTDLARGLVAVEWLDSLHGREPGLRSVFTTLFVTMARATAFTSRNLEHYLRAEHRIDFGSGSKRKRRGRGCLDPATAAELEQYICGRNSGPLFLGPRGARTASARLLSWWREAFGLGVVFSLWPDGEPWSLDAAHAINIALIHGKPRVGRAGNPSLVRESTRAAWRRKEREVLAAAEPLREEWTLSMQKVTLHSFRHTHETWALAENVPQHVINIQAGWELGSSRSGEDLKRMRKCIGKSHYADADSSLLEPRTSALAVRRMLEEGLAEVEEEMARLLARSSASPTDTKQDRAPQDFGTRGLTLKADEGDRTLNIQLGKLTLYH